MIVYDLNPISGKFDMYDDGTTLPMHTITNPATNAAVLTTILNNYSGVIITTTMSSNGQTMQSPTVTTAGKIFTVVNNDSSTSAININGINLLPKEAQRFIWDGTAWVPVTAVDAEDITFVPSGGMTATTVQAAIEELRALIS